MMIIRSIATYGLSCLWIFFIFISERVNSQVYNDIAPQIGLDVATVSSDNFGSGVSFYDFDQNGWDDLTFTSDSSEIRMFRNVSGEFVEVSHNIPPLGILKEAIWFDYDQDGLMDLLTSSRLGKYKLFKNQGDFNFLDVSVAAGLNQLDRPHYGVAVGDYNKDSFLDFYLCLYTYTGEDTDLFSNNQLFRNNGDGTFTNVTMEAGVGGGIATSFDAAWMDYDADGWPDLYVINDRVPYNNVMYRNNGDGTFTDVTEETNTGFNEQNPMTVSVSDFDNDGDLDIYLTNIGGETVTSLLVNDGEGNYSDQSLDWGVQNNFYSWGALWVDRENDGWRDLYVATSPIGSSSPVFKDLFYKHSVDHFVLNQDVLTDLNVERSYGLAKGDINNDGYSDIVTHSISPYPSNLWLNSGGVRNYVKITLQGTASNAQAIGSWIQIYAGGRQFTEYTRCGDNYVSQNSQHMIFGLGSTGIIDSLTVLFPSGHTDRYYDLAVNEHYYLTEGETYSVGLSSNGVAAICEGDSMLVDAGDHPNYLWNTGDTSQAIYASESGIYWTTVQNEFGVTIYSDSLEVIVNANPVIQYETQHLLCHGENTGAIFIQNVTGIPEDLVLWSSGHEGTALDSLPAGLYNYTFIDVNGCETTGEILLQEPMLLSVLVFPEPDSGNNDGSLWLVINGGTPPYQIYLNGILQESVQMNDLAAGFYELIVIDNNDCVFNASLEVPTITNSVNLDSKRLRVFPNPVSSKQSLFIDGLASTRLNRVEIFDMLGKQVWAYDAASQIKGQYELPIEVPSEGQYLIRCYFHDHHPISRTLLISD